MIHRSFGHSRVNAAGGSDTNTRRDRVPDESYVKKGSSLSQYLTEPWNHYKDPLESYLSLRFAEKDQFLGRLKARSSSGWKQVEQEIARIKADRGKHLGDSNKQDLENELKTSYQIWQQTVFDPTELRQIGLDRQKQVRKKKFDAVHKAGLQAWDEAHLEELHKLAGDRKKSTDEQAQPAVQERHKNKINDPYHGFRAGAMYFEKRTDGTLRGISSENEGYGDTKFPNQKIALQRILDQSSNNPLRERHNNHVRYFHFPSNNMEWIEKAIKQYYSRNDAHPADLSRLLNREHWAGQMHGGEPLDRAYGEVPVHSRHMRSKCLLVPRDPQSYFPTTQPASPDPTNPGTPRARTVSSVSQAGKNVAIFLPYLHWETSSRRAQMVKVINKATASTSKKKPTNQLMSDFVDQLTDQKAKAQANSKSKSKNKASTLPRRQHLGRYLLAVARMAEAMDYEADELLLRRKVNTKSPLHIRRTLDQYYFLTLDNTSERDRDQVVYRGTRSLSLTTRVVMVDQLWMWILDDNTIITAFPRRWGRNKPDPSGVHKSLRERLRQKTEAIKSIQHLAMIIMDQCSRVFFDKTRPLDERPEVMDLFAAAIGTVAEKTRIAYDHFWRSIAVDPQYKGPLVINPEGIVLKEAQDIAEELMIMKRVYGEQLKVAKDFMRHLAHPRGRHAAMSADARLIRRLLIELGNATRRDDEEAQEQYTPDLETLLGEEPAQETHEAHELVEVLLSRLAEITDLEEAALRACSQLEGLLQLKQQQASIVDARAALETANESYKQGRTIQAFTIVTIVFLPLGFIAAFFGMNNDEINEAKWMSLWQQIKWMFGGTAVVIFISVSLAFGSWFQDLTAWARVVLRFSFDIPWALFFQSTEMSRFHEWWKGSLWNSKNLDRKRKTILAGIAKKRREEEEHLATQNPEGENKSVGKAIADMSLGREDTEQETDASAMGENRLLRRVTTRLGWGPKEDVDEEGSV